VNWVVSNSDPGFIQSSPSQTISFGGNQFVYSTSGYNYNNSLDSSADGYSWNNVASLGYSFTGGFLTYGQGTFVAGAGNRNIYQSGVFSTNSSPAATTLGISTYPGVTINGTAGAVYQIQCSTNLNAWQTLTNFMLPSSPFIWVDTSSTVTGQRFYRSVQLP